MYVPAWPGLSPAYFWQSRNRNLPFPLSASNGLYFYVARNAIYHLFRDLAARGKGPVLVPDYHSGNEVWAIRAAGAPVRFYHVDRHMEPDLDEIESLARKERPLAIYAIHFIGWPAPIRQLQTLCRGREITLVEDCALSLLGEVEGRPLGSFGDYAVYCLYKTVPVPNGGLLVGTGGALGRLSSLELGATSPASIAGRSMELTLEWLRSRSETIGQGLFRVKRGVGRALDRMSVERTPIGDIGFDLRNVGLGMSSFCRRLLDCFDYDTIRARRRANFKLMLRLLGGRATPLRTDLDEGVCPLFFPILVPDKTAAAEALWSRGVEVVEFWNYGDSEAERPGSGAQFLREHVLELPIHQDITPAQIEYAADQVAALGLRFERAAAAINDPCRYETHPVDTAQAA